jgi:hypothetical protein
MSTEADLQAARTPAITRRSLLKQGAALALLSSAARAVAEEPAEPSITCFYQFGRGALDAFRTPDGLPNGAGYLHIFSHSHPGMNPHPDTAKLVRAAGSSYRYALALDVHKYPGWMQAPDDQLKKWAEEFRAQALDADGPADYFAFNEMPTTGAATPHLREQAAKWLRLVHASGGGPKLRGVFYFTERNLTPAHWQGESDGFWEALDETCDLVVGEHYHSYDFELQRTPEKLAEHLFALPRWLEASGKSAQLSIARRKYTVLHSSYFGTAMSGWAGVQSDKHDPTELERYFEHMLTATRSVSYGKRRVAFGPLAARELDTRVFPVLAKCLGKDLRSP